MQNITEITNVIDYFVAKIQPLGIKGYEMLMKQVPIQLLKTKIWIWVFGISLGLAFLITFVSTFFAIKEAEDELIPLSIIMFIAMVVFGALLANQIMDIYQLKLKFHFLLNSA